MTDLNEIIRNCIDDIWKHLNCSDSDAIDKLQIKKVVCTMLSTNEHISDDFESEFTKFGKTDSSKMDKQELNNFIKFMHGIPYELPASHTR